MNAKTAVARRIHALCLERNIAINALANQCGIAPLHDLQYAEYKE